MVTPVKYVGVSKPFFETAITGGQGSWMPGQVRDRSDTDAALLIASGSFSKALTNVVDGNADATDGSAVSPVIDSLVSGAGILPASNYTYESSGAFRLIGYTRGGIAHSITYPTSTTALITSAQGYQRSITLDASGRTVGVV